jgi:hypothetical protein
LIQPPSSRQFLFETGEHDVVVEDGFAFGHGVGVRCRAALVRQSPRRKSSAVPLDD